MRGRRAGWRRLALLCLAAGFPTTGAAGEEVKLSQDWSFDFSTEVRLRGEGRGDNDLNTTLDDDRREGLQRVRLALGVEKKGEARAFIQIQDSRVAGQEGLAGADSTTANDRNVDLHQGFVEITAFGDSGLSLYAGRREWKYGDERLIGAFGWDNVGRAFDGGTLRWTRKQFWLDGFYAQVDQEPNPVDAAKGTRGDSLSGAYAHWSPRQGDEWEAYTLYFRDSEKLAGETGAAGTTRIGMAGGRARSRVERFDYLVEGGVQRGRFNGDDHRAWAAAAQAGLTLGPGKHWRAFAGYDYATGDRNSADGAHQEFFNFFPTNHPHYGYMDLFGWRNLRSPYLGAALSSGRHWAQARLHDFNLQSSRGRWSSAGGVTLGFDAGGSSGTNVGREADLTYRFKWTAHVSVEADLSRFEPGEFADQARPGSAGDPSTFAYLMLTFAL